MKLRALPILVLAACTSMQSENPLDLALTGEGEEFVEGWIEFSGGGRDFAAGETVSIRVDTRAGANANVVVSPNLWPKNGPQFGEEATVSRRKIAAAVALPLKSDQAKAQLGLLSLAIAPGKEREPAGGNQPCLSPVKIRLVKVDGVVSERTGCRGDSAWVRLASEIGAKWLAAQ